MRRKALKAIAIILLGLMGGVFVAELILISVVFAATVISVINNPILIPSIVLAAFIIGSLYILVNKIGNKIEARWTPKGVKQSEGL